MERLHKKHSIKAKRAKLKLYIFGVFREQHFFSEYVFYILQINNINIFVFSKYIR